MAFWKRAYEQSEAEQSKLLDRIYDLERRNESLQSKAQTHGPIREPEPERKRAKTQAYPLADRNGIREQYEYLEECTYSCRWNMAWYLLTCSASSYRSIYEALLHTPEGPAKKVHSL